MSNILWTVSGTEEKIRSRELLENLWTIREPAFQKSDWTDVNSDNFSKYLALVLLSNFHTALQGTEIR